MATAQEKCISCDARAAYAGSGTAIHTSAPSHGPLRVDGAATSTQAFNNSRDIASWSSFLATSHAISIVS